MSRAGNLAASVDHQLRNLARENSRPIADVRIRYVLERFLYRLSLSQYRDEYVLTGAFVRRPWRSRLSAKPGTFRVAIVRL